MRVGTFGKTIQIIEGSEMGRNFSNCLWGSEERHATIYADQRKHLLNNYLFIYIIHLE
jgi:hypothetical protein